jgi:hypothetical protein
LWRSFPKYGSERRAKSVRITCPSERWRPALFMANRSVGRPRGLNGRSVWAPGVAYYAMREVQIE